MTASALADDTSPFNVSNIHDKLLGQDYVVQKKIESQTESTIPIIMEQIDLKNPRGQESIRHDAPLVSHGNISWVLSDSKGNEYHLTLTSEEYRQYSRTIPSSIQNLATIDGKIMAVVDYTAYIQSNEKFAQLTDEVYRNAKSDFEFLQEIKYIVSSNTNYSPEMTDRASLPFETLYIGKGDCEDLTILMASLLISSYHTKDWDIKIVYLDAFNASDSTTVNHLALFVSTDKFTTFIETTNDDLNVWNKIQGWYMKVPRFTD
jgi:transglutaminase-like putative cysteine protease